MNRTFGNLPTPHPEILTPGGRLTLVTGTPFVVSDQTSKTAVYYTPCSHGYFPVIKNGVVKPVYFGDADLLLTLTSAHALSTIYDIFGIEQGGKGALATGVAWSNSGAGVGSRGTAGVTELTRAAGFQSNKYGMAGLNGSGSVYIPPQEGTYLGSIFMDGSAGQVTCHTTFGTSRKWGLWNAHNQAPVLLKGGDGTGSWSVGGAGSVQAQNGASANSLTVFRGGSEAPIRISLRQLGSLTSNQSGGATTGWIRAGIGYNATNAFSGKYGMIDQTWSNMSAGLSLALRAELVAEYIVHSAIGIHTVTACEQFSNSLSQSLYGTEANGVLSAEWLG